MPIVLTTWKGSLEPRSSRPVWTKWQINETLSPQNGRIGGEGDNTDSLLAHGYKHAQFYRCVKCSLERLREYAFFLPQDACEEVIFSCPLRLPPHLHCPSTACGLFHRLLSSLPLTLSCRLADIFSRTVVLCALRIAAACLNSAHPRSQTDSAIFSPFYMLSIFLCPVLLSLFSHRFA